MKPVDAREARRAATKKGFVDEGGDHYYLYFYYQNLKTNWRIKISRGADEYKPSHMRADAQVCGNMPAPDIRKIVACDHDEKWVIAEYEKRVVSRHR